jgi:transposase
MITKKTRKIHTQEFKQEAVNLAAKKASTSQREAELAAEVARLKRQLAEQAEDLAILKKAATYFAKNQK